MTAHPLDKFDTLWREISQDGVITVQDRTELEYIFNLIRGCKSYLEIGTAEGKSLYVLAHALAEDAEIAYVDLGEAHTKERRDHYLGKLSNKITGIHGDSTQPGIVDKLPKGEEFDDYFDVVMIDAGHDTFCVMSDAIIFGGWAKKYLIFHDVQLPEVGRVFDWYAAQFYAEKRAYRLVNSQFFGYGIIEI